MKARCKQCGFVAAPAKFNTTMSYYHDLRCPECETTAVDTSELNAEIKDYGYGDNNSLQFKDSDQQL